MAKKKEPGTAVIPWEQELAAAAKNQSEAPKTGGGDRTFLSFKSGQMSYGDRPIKENKIDVIILDYAYVNQFYPNVYNPKAPESPSCYALGRTTAEMAPHKDAEDPQSELCAKCPQNEWGSRGDGGQGKACKNGIRLTIMAAGDLAGDIEKAAIAYVSIPPTSAKSFGAYHKEEFCDEVGSPTKPTYVYTTTIEVVPDKQSQFKILFSRTKGGDITDRAVFYALRDKVKKLSDDVLFAFPKNADMPKAVKPGARAAKRKF